MSCLKGPLDKSTRKKLIDTSPIAGKYEALKDRESAYEMLLKRSQAAAQDAARAEEKEQDETASPWEREYKAGRRYSGTRVGRSTSRTTRTTKPKDTFGTAMTEAVIKELKGTTGRRIVRGIFGTLFKGR